MLREGPSKEGRGGHSGEGRWLRKRGLEGVRGISAQGAAVELAAEGRKEESRRKVDLGARSLFWAFEAGS